MHTAFHHSGAATAEAGAPIHSNRMRPIETANRLDTPPFLDDLHQQRCHHLHHIIHLDHELGF